MIISLAVLVVPLILIVAFCQPDKSSHQRRAIDPSRTYQTAAQQYGLQVRQPGQLPRGWRATYAALQTDTSAVVLRVSYLTPGGDYLQLVQSAIPAPTLIPDELGGGKIRGQEQLAGLLWQRYSGRRAGETAFVLVEPRVTVIVAGDASGGQLRAFVSSLR